MSKRSKTILLLTILLTLLVSAGITAWAEQGGGSDTTSAATAATTPTTATTTATTTETATTSTTTTTTTTTATTAGEDIVISQEVLDRIQLSDPVNFDRNIANYKNLLVSLQADPAFKLEIEKLVMEGFALPEILIGYEFLYDRFGKIGELPPLVVKQAEGQAWKDIFTGFNQAHAEFKPRTFDSDYLEQLMKTPDLSADDIMIADRLSFATGVTFEKAVAGKQEASHWKAVAAKAGVLFSGDTLPRVQITNEQMQMYRNQGGLTDDQIAEAFVIAHKIGKEAKDVIAKIKEGYSTEAIFAESYEEKYR